MNGCQWCCIRFSLARVRPPVGTLPELQSLLATGNDASHLVISLVTPTWPHGFDRSCGRPLHLTACLFTEMESSDFIANSELYCSDSDPEIADWGYVLNKTGSSYAMDSLDVRLGWDKVGNFGCLPFTVKESDLSLWLWTFKIAIAGKTLVNKLVAYVTFKHYQMYCQSVIIWHILCSRWALASLLAKLRWWLCMLSNNDKACGEQDIFFPRKKMLQTCMLRCVANLRWHCNVLLKCQWLANYRLVAYSQNEVTGHRQVF